MKNRMLVMVKGDIKNITASPDGLDKNQTRQFWDNLKRHYGPDVYLAESVFIVPKSTNSLYTHVIASIVTGHKTITQTHRMINKGDPVERLAFHLARLHPAADYIHTQEV